MTYTTLTEEEQKIVGACLRAAVEGPFFPDWEFFTLFGLTRFEVRLVADRYPAVDEDDDEPTGNDDSWLAINNTFANLLGCPHGNQADWSAWIPVPISEVERIFGKWKRETEPSNPANPRNAGGCCVTLTEGKSNETEIRVQIRENWRGLLERKE